MLTSSAPQAVNLGQERDGPALPGLTRSVFRELEVEHFSSVSSTVLRNCARSRTAAGGRSLKSFIDPRHALCQQDIA
eukprot:500274-Amphidinium_carterae.1